MVTIGSDRTSGISRNSALRRRWHPETKVIAQTCQDEPVHGSGQGEDEIQRPPQKALALRVKFLDPGKSTEKSARRPNSGFSRGLGGKTRPAADPPRFSLAFGPRGQ